MTQSIISAGSSTDQGIQLQGGNDGSLVIQTGVAGSKVNAISIASDGTPTFLKSGLVLGTAQNTTSGTSIDFTGIPSWAKRITVMLNGVSTNGSSIPLLQLGTAGGVITAGYTSGAWTGNTTYVPQTTGFGLCGIGGASYDLEGNLIICTDGNNNWTSSHMFNQNVAGTIAMGGGKVALGATLTRVRLTTVNGTDTFDAGSVNIMYEG